MLVYLSFPERGGEPLAGDLSVVMPDVQATFPEAASGHTPLMVEVVDTRETLIINLEYLLSHHTQASADRMLDELIRILAHVAGSPGVATAGRLGEPAGSLRGPSPSRP